MFQGLRIKATKHLNNPVSIFPFRVNTNRARDAPQKKLPHTFGNLRRSGLQELLGYVQVFPPECDLTLQFLQVLRILSMLGQRLSLLSPKLFIVNRKSRTRVWCLVKVVVNRERKPWHLTSPRIQT
jgi:hypothetical protein